MSAKHMTHGLGKLYKIGVDKLLRNELVRKACRLFRKFIVLPYGETTATLTILIVSKRNTKVGSTSIERTKS